MSPLSRLVSSLFPVSRLVVSSFISYMLTTSFRGTFNTGQESDEPVTGNEKAISETSLDDLDKFFSGVDTIKDSVNNTLIHYELLFSNLMATSFV